MNANTPGSFIVLLITVLVSLAGLYGQPKLIERCLFRPYYVTRNKEYHTIFTSGLVHANLSHLLFNMFTFYFFAPPLEQVIGTARFVILYVLALALSETRTYLRERGNSRYATLGASGAVSAILFAAIVYFPTQSLFIFPLPIPIPAPIFAVGYLLYAWYASRNGRSGINHIAHIDGAITGLLFVLITDSDAYGRLLSVAV